MKKIWMIFALILAMTGILMADQDSPTVTPTNTEADTFTATPTNTLTATPTSTLNGTMTDTPVCSPTISATITETYTDSPTPTITVTPTITPTWTPWPGVANATPQENVFAYPNPAKSDGRMAIAYPVDSAKTPQEVKIIIYAADGELAAKAVENGPYWGYTSIDLTKFARGVYMYKVTIRYTDGTEQALPARKFAVVR